MKLVGLSGGIATGKSTVSTLLKGRNIPIVDCDEIAHSVVKKGRWGYRRVVAAFGPMILLANGDIDREKLGAKIFPDSAARRRLNAATHPAVFLEIACQLAWHWLTCTWVVVIDMPLLFETGFYRLTSPRALVTCSHDIEVERLMRRDACSREAAEAKVAAQMPLAEKRRRANVVIDNSGTRQDTERQVEELAARLRRGAVWQGLLTSPIAVGAVLVWLARMMLR